MTAEIEHRQADYVLDGSPEAVAIVREARGLAPLPELDRWDKAVDWLLNHRASFDTNPLFFAYVDGVITEEELRAEVTSDMEPDGVMHRSIYDVINDRREATDLANRPDALDPTIEPPGGTHV